MGMGDRMTEDERYYDNRLAYFAMEADHEPTPASFYKRKWWEDTTFVPKKNYPRGVLQKVDLDLDELGLWELAFFPECSDVRHAQVFRSSVDGDKESFKLGLSAYVNCPNESWSLDEISNGEWSGLKPRKKYENRLMKKDIATIKEMIDLQSDLSLEEERELRAIDEEQPGWTIVDPSGLNPEADEFIPNEMFVGWTWDEMMIAISENEFNEVCR